MWHKHVRERTCSPNRNPRSIICVCGWSSMGEFNTSQLLATRIRSIYPERSEHQTGEQHPPDGGARAQSHRSHSTTHAQTHTYITHSCGALSALCMCVIRPPSPPTLDILVQTLNIYEWKSVYYSQMRASTAPSVPFHTYTHTHRHCAYIGAGARRFVPPDE